MCNKSAITKKVRKLKELEQQISELEIQAEALKDAIKAEMINQGVNEMSGTDWKVTWTPYISNRFDQSSFKEIHPDLYESFKVAVESRRFSVK